MTSKEEALALAKDYFDPFEEEFIAVEYYTDGHEGPGWYCWDVQYPEDGSCFICD